jgi:hypothetical protein
MSMEVHVLFAGKLPSKAALTRAMRELGFPCIITDKGSLERQRGYMPMRVRREESGIEFDVFDGRETIEELAGDDADESFNRSANFRWGGDEDEMLAALCTSAALAQMVKGVIVNDWDDRPVTSDEAIAYARKQLFIAAKPARQVAGTRPADIKRYLKPLLGQRGDLALVGRMLVIRPVRHLLRGAFLDRTVGKHRLEVRRCITPLYMPVSGAGERGDDPDGRGFDVWQPFFIPLLLDRLREDVFAQVGRMTTLEHFATFISGWPDRMLTHITSLVLAGQRERAAECVGSITRGELFGGYRKGEVEDHWQRLNRDIDVVCAEFHANEAETVRALKLEHLWEPSPFPVELAVGDQASRWDEPAFPLSPWIARPPGLLQELPEQPGEVRFAKEFLRRDGVTPVLVAALTPEQAEERHRNFEQYILAAGLPEGLRLMVRRHGGRDRHDPMRFEILERIRRTTGREPPDPWPLCPGGEPPSMTLHIEVHGRSNWLLADASDLRVGAGRVQFYYIDVRAQGPQDSSWHCWFDVETGEKRIHDSRTGEKIYTRPKLTPSERDLLVFATPAFGEYDELTTRLRSLLQTSGYGKTM